MSRREDFTNTALGLVSAESFPGIVGIADHMLKASEVTLVGYEKIGSGHCTAVVRGNIADVRLAVAEGAEWAERFFGQQASTVVIARPMPNLDAVLPIGSRLLQYAPRGRSKLSNLAIGLLETKGFPAMVGASDAMLKAADVVLGGYETIGSGLCTAVIRGTVANVMVAINVGAEEADRIGQLHAVMVVQRPLDDLEHTLPTASCWLEDLQQPLRIPVTLKETEKERVALPDAEQERQSLTMPNPELDRIDPVNQLPRSTEHGLNLGSSAATSDPVQLSALPDRSEKLRRRPRET